MTIKVKHEFIGQRLDQFLLNQYFIDKSRSYIQNLIKTNKILVNNIEVKTGYQLKENDLIEIFDVVESSLNLEAIDLSLEIVYEDNDLIVINKPQGLVVHPASSYQGHTLVHGLLYQASNLSSINGVIRPGIVHRIDKDTSGLLVVAKNDEAHQFLSNELKDHLIKREYVALVYGTFLENEGKIDAPIQRNPKNRLKMAVIQGGKHAVTHFKVIERFDKYTLLSVTLETGRTHQIRVHMAYIKHPIVGDPIYGPKDVIGNTGQFLHAKKLTFLHPTKKELVTFDSELPSNFTKFLKDLR
jgi:23S rRNA pseudouridine1911/1915/1917 synthase